MFWINVLMQRVTLFFSFCFLTDCVHIRISLCALDPVSPDVTQLQSIIDPSICQLTVNNVFFVQMLQTLRESGHSISLLPHQSTALVKKCLWRILLLFYIHQSFTFVRRSQVRFPPDTHNTANQHHYSCVKPFLVSFGHFVLPFCPAYRLFYLSGPGLPYIVQTLQTMILLKIASQKHFYIFLQLFSALQSLLTFTFRSSASSLTVTMPVQNSISAGFSISNESE